MIIKQKPHVNLALHYSVFRRQLSYVMWITYASFRDSMQLPNTLWHLKSTLLRSSNKVLSSSSKICDFNFLSQVCVSVIANLNNIILFILFHVSVGRRANKFSFVIVYIFKRAICAVDYLLGGNMKKYIWELIISLGLMNSFKTLKTDLQKMFEKEQQLNLWSPSGVFTWKPDIALIASRFVRYRFFAWNLTWNSLVRQWSFLKNCMLFWYISETFNNMFWDKEVDKCAIPANVKIFKSK